MVIFAITKTKTLVHVHIPRVLAVESILQCSATTEKIKPKLNTMTTIGSTLNPALSSVYSRNMVPELPPAPAARVLDGRAFLRVSLWSAAARRRMVERGPPGGEAARARLEEVPVGLEGVSVPESAETGEEGRSTCHRSYVSIALDSFLAVHNVVQGSTKLY